MDTKFTIERTHYYAPAINVVMAVTIIGDPEIVTPLVGLSAQPKGLYH